MPDVSLDTRWDAFSRAHPELRIRSIACIPIRSGEKTLGVIQLLNTKLDLESEYSISFLRILCDYAAIAIQNARSVKLIHELTITDDCTGLFNARHLYTLLDEQIELAATIPETRFSLLFVDLDHFKLVNDTHGHLIGSRLLAEVGGLMRRALGPANSCFRYGGDEFVALLPGLEKQPAIDATMKLWEQLRKARFLTGQGLFLALAGSFGLATFPEDGASVPAIIRAADTMMYEAKTTRDNIAVAGLGLLTGAKPAVPSGKTATMPPETSKPAASHLPLTTENLLKLLLPPLQRHRPLRLRLDRVPVLRRHRMHAKVPHPQVDLVLRYHLHQRVLAEVQRPLRRQLHPVASRQHLARRLDHVLLLLHRRRPALRC